MKFNSLEYKQHFSALAKRQGFGGYTGKQREYSEIEINDLVNRCTDSDSIHTFKSLFSDKIYDSLVKWKNDVGRHLDKDSRRRFYSIIFGPAVCFHCNIQLSDASYDLVSGFSKFCPECVKNRVWVSYTNQKEKGKKISEAKLKFYQTDYGKEVAESIGQKNAISMKLYNSTEKGKETIKKNAKKSSIRMKQRILSGEFTPQIKNSRTHWTAEYNGKKYRSSWEAMWQALNTDHEYEKTRIQYTFENVDKIYIVDFTDIKNKTLYEIKPTEHTTDSKVKAKENAAIAWCSAHGYKFKIITQKQLLHYKNELLESDLPDNIKQKVLKLYEKN